MRTLLAAVATLFAVGAMSPAVAFSFTPTVSDTSSVVQGLPDAGAAGLTVVNKKKKRKSKGKESASFQDIGNAKRGKSDLEIRVKVSRSERTCELKIEWNNDDTSEDEVDADDDKICEFSVEVPGDRDIVGDATATVTVRDSSGKKVASAKKTFPVK